MEEIIKRLTALENRLTVQNLIMKRVFNFPEAAEYLQLSHSHLYRLTSTRKIPFYRPSGKKLYFKRKELDNWLLRNRSTTKDELEQQAADYLIEKGDVKL